MSGVMMKFSATVRAAASGANAAYITRESATRGDEEGIHLHNLEELRGGDYRETRTNIISYAAARQDDELTRPRRGGGETRTHYRMMLSWDRREETGKAVSQIKEYIENQFPRARAVVAIHQDTDNTHGHVWLDARQTDGRKISIGRADYKTLDDRWAGQYARHYGREYERDHLAKKEETRAMKGEAVRAKGEGRRLPPRPPRLNLKALPAPERKAATRAVMDVREARNYGANEGTVGRDQPELAIRATPIARDGAGERGATPGERLIERVVDVYNRALAAARSALQSVERLRDRAHGRELGEGRGR